MQISKEVHSFDPAEILKNYFSHPEEVKVLDIFQENVISVELDGKKYTIKKYPQDFSPERAEFITRLQNIVINEMGILPPVIPTLEGPLFVRIGDHIYDLTELVDNVEPDSNDIENAENFFFKIGSFVGSLHTSFSKFNTEDSLVLDSLLNIYHPTSNHFAELMTEYESEDVAEEWIKILQEKSNIATHYANVIGLFSELPRSIVHGDVYMKNLLFDKNQKIIGLIDFAHAGIFFKCYEVFRSFIQTNKFLNEVDIDPDHLKIFLEGYTTTSSLEDIELQMMLDLFIYTQAADISFLDTTTVKSGNSTADYAKFRFNSLLSLHENRERLQAVINEVGK